MRKWSFLLLIALVYIIPLWPQAGLLPPNDDPASYIGLTLLELYDRLGPPESVYAARGPEEWQDDVVFVYKQGDFYILKDRVWQTGLKSAMGIRAGDNVATVSLILGSIDSARPAESVDSSGGQKPVFYFLDGKSWPMILRCEFDKQGRVTMIFIYRSDL